MSDKSFLMMDMGGTNVRLAIARGSRLTHIRKYKVCDFERFYDLLDDYRVKVGSLPDTFLMALPTPSGGDRVSFINNPWTFRLSGLKKRYGFKDIQVLNDFKAVAMALPHLRAKDLIRIGKGKALSSAPKLVLGAGTGLGVGIWTPQGVLSSEGGHMTMPFLPVECELQNFLSAKYRGHVSAERLISGQGLENIYAYLSRGKCLPALDILNCAERGERTARKAVGLMLRFLGRVAGDLALAVEPFGGVYLCGGVLQHPAVLAALEDSEFVREFNEKGRRSGLLSIMPKYLIVRQCAAFVGLLHFFDKKE